MRRREFMTLLGGAAIAWPLTARAQQAMPVIAFLGPAPASGYARRLNGMRAGLGEFGYVENRNFVFEFRWADRPDQLPSLATELIQRRPAVIATSGNAATLAAKLEAGSIPVVFSVADDPVRLGVVESFNRPGGNATGVSLVSGGLGAKRIGLLRELKPDATLIAILINPKNPAEANVRDEHEEAKALGQKLLVLPASDERELQSAFLQAAQGHAGAMLVNADAFFTSRLEEIVGLAMRFKLPAMYAWREFPDGGGLMSYGVSLDEAYRQKGIYIGRILQGVKPADLPVIQPTKIELVINLKTAKSLGLEIPAKLLALADAVIE